VGCQEHVFGGIGAIQQTKMIPSQIAVFGGTLRFNTYHYDYRRKNGLFLTKRCFLQALAYIGVAYHDKMTGLQIVGGGSHASGIKNLPEVILIWFFSLILSYALSRLQSRNTIHNLIPPQFNDYLIINYV
jgi:hypothetical protein